jgi:ribose transport system substrate-binding protein
MKRALFIFIILFFLAFTITLSLKIISLLNQVEALAQRYKFENKSTEGNLYHFFVIIPDRSDSFWKLFKRGVLDAGEQNKVTIEFAELKTFDLEEQKSYMEQAIASKVDGIILDAFSNEVFTALINKSHDKGIPVVTVLQDSNESKRVTYIGTDYYNEGMEAAKAMAKALKESGDVIVLATNRDENSEVSMAEKRKIEGFMEIMKNYPKVRSLIIERVNMDSNSKSTDIKSLLDKKSDLKGIFCTDYDTTIALGQILSKSKDRQSIPVVGYGTTYEVLDYIRKGTISAATAQNAYKMGYLSVEKMVQSKKKEKIDSSYNTGVVLVTKENVDTFIK